MTTAGGAFTSGTLTISLHSAVMLALDKLQILQRPVRPSAPLSRAGSPYAGNITGGALVGLGMSLSGACPGTVLVQLAQGIPSSRAAFLGSLIGGIVYTPVAQHLGLLAPARTAKKTTIPEATGLSPSAIYSLLGASICGVLWATAPLVRSPNANSIFSNVTAVTIPPVVGGLLIGVAQAASMLLTATPLGVSRAYAQLADYLLQAFGLETASSCSSKSAIGTEDQVSTARSKSKTWPPPASLLFAAGIMAGSIALTAWQPGFAAGLASEAPVPAWRAITGGIVMVLGARLGGGCTSGHGLSGMGSLSLSSLFAVAAMFATGIGSRLLVVGAKSAF